MYGRSIGDFCNNFHSIVKNNTCTIALKKTFISLIKPITIEVSHKRIIIIPEPI